ncbi:hypothetical protein EMPG_09494 [Blastomyces silverae]|uniref:Uncharacterized protein n=1 Tax=Blastomyces silverae TaxID=2060906 RepID=A0A0H1BUD9_9EURO|nr:hypothetical protein EMPG_09494 [Blastomyces silverae]
MSTDFQMVDNSKGRLPSENEPGTFSDHHGEALVGESLNNNALNRTKLSFLHPVLRKDLVLNKDYYQCSGDVR